MAERTEHAADRAGRDSSGAPGQPVDTSPPGVAVKRARAWTTLVTSLAAMLMTLDITVVNVALPQIGTDLSASLDGLQWVVNGYTLAFAALLLTAGSLSDRLGRKKVFLVGVAAFTVASVLCALSPNVGLLITARVLQGLGGAMVLGTALALIAGAFEGAPASARNRAIALFTAGGAAAATLGPLVGGLIVDSLSWEFLFWVNVPIGLLIILGTLWRVPESAGGEQARVDWAGAVLAVGALFALNYGLLAGAEHGWGRADVLVGLVAGAVLAVTFVLVQWRLRARAMLDLRLFAIPSFTGAMVLSFAARIISFGMFPFVILWLGGIQHLSPLQIGLVLMTMSLALVVAAPLGGALVRVTSVSVVLATGMAVAGVGMLVATGLAPDDSWTAILPLLVLVGLGTGLILPQLLGIAVGVVPAAKAGTASGAVNSFFPLGTSIGVAVFGIVLTGQVRATLSADALGAAGVTGDAGVVQSLVSAGQFEAAAAQAGNVGPAVLELARLAYTEALGQIFLIAGISALVAAVAGLVLIRAKDVHEPERSDARA